MTPGPTRVPARVLAAGARPMVHHRSPEFSRELADVLQLIAPVFGTADRVLPVHATGRGAMEAVIANLCSAGDEILVCANGKFGEMWGTLAEAYGVVAHRIATDWSFDIDPEDVDAGLKRWPNVRAVALAFSDTSTGVCNDVAGIARIAHAHGVLTFVDGVSSIGGMPFAFDEWGIDVALTASQKCLMSSPGLSFVAMSTRAWAETERAHLPKSYWDFAVIRSHISESSPTPPGTPPVHVIFQVAEALRLMHEEGLDAVYRRHAAMAQRAREGAALLGLNLQCPGLARLADTVTALVLPVTPQGLRERLKARGIVTAGALGRYEGRAFRIGHMGDIRVADVDRTMTAIGEIMRDGAVPASVEAVREPPARGF
jgi:aspartate aminotransferase-like enzyme